MNPVVIQHVAVSDLPESWRRALGHCVGKEVTVRIESPASDAQVLPARWAEREDHADCTAVLNRLQTPSY